MSVLPVPTPGSLSVVISMLRCRCSRFIRPGHSVFIKACRCSQFLRLGHSVFVSSMCTEAAHTCWPPPNDVIGQIVFGNTVPCYGGGSHLLAASQMMSCSSSLGNTVPCHGGGSHLLAASQMMSCSPSLSTVCLEGLVKSETNSKAKKVSRGSSRQKQGWVRWAIEISFLFLGDQCRRRLL